MSQFLGLWLPFEVYVIILLKSPLKMFCRDFIQIPKKSFKLRSKK